MKKREFVKHHAILILNEQADWIEVNTLTKKISDRNKGMRISTNSVSRLLTELSKTHNLEKKKVYDRGSSYTFYSLRL